MRLLNQSTRPFLSLIAMLMLLFLISGCSSSKNITGEAEEDFDQFYDRFHQDVTFQMSRIMFPLEGGIEDNTGRKDWTRANWMPLKVKIQDVDTSKYKVEFNKTDTEFTQRFWLPGSGFSSEYHFKKILGQWFLVYAEDVNL